MLDINDLKSQGIIIKLNGEPYIVLRSQHARTAQRRAFVRTSLRNLITGKTIDKTFNASDKIEKAEIKKTKANFLYQKGDNFYFMNLENFEEIPIKAESFGEKKDFLLEGSEISILYFEGTPISLELPQKITLKVIEAPLAVRGDTSQGKVMKTVELETGLKIEVPFFINQGDKIIINTETRKYIERA